MSLRERADALSNRQFCACEVYPAGFDTGCVVCWVCELPVGVVDWSGAATVDRLFAQLEAVKNERDLALLSLAALTPHNPKENA